ncbi:class I SAM-dependent methyltransferase [Rhodococcus xishaensis]|uniref:Class I SAM-dependent methyltransferase n=1 Tax=Rhodococcus xishaensis TaxID=2487364 RepID=A0A438ANF2_9NOCA|nr:class I SAM-dependent methyltransferase [Rhodococcus xishaensis]RVW00204.1 class I SAM-dependent methyltransferase [Rhodococcus xishaensis]
MNEPEAFWDKSASKYDKTEERFEYIHTKSRENAKKHLKGADIILDYGCGTGTTSCELASEVKEIHSLDISSKMIELADEKAAASGVANVTFVQADIFDKRYEEGTFDAILAFNVLHTVPNPHKVVERMHALLKPQGLVISVTPCLRDKMSLLVGIQILLFRILSKIGIIPIPVRRLKSSELDDLLKSRNFQIIDAENIYKGASSYFMVAKRG